MPKVFISHRLAIIFYNLLRKINRNIIFFKDCPGRGGGLNLGSSWFSFIISHKQCVRPLGYCAPYKRIKRFGIPPVRTQPTHLESLHSPTTVRHGQSDNPKIVKKLIRWIPVSEASSSGLTK